MPRTAETEASKALIGQVLANRYKIEAWLGEGAMGAVYKARHVKVGRLFAVKTLHPRMLEDKKVVQRFEREAELAGRLRHPNVAGVVDVSETPDGLRYMVMEFAEGRDLASLLSEAPMPPPRVMSLTRQMLEGLYHAHEHGLIHRDFKPENVIVERDSNGLEIPRIVDFGIAILRDGSDPSDMTSRLTTNGLVLGTPHYMAPEQAVADKLDHRIDLFALGIMVYEMLSGKLPFDGNGAAVARANLMLDPPAIAMRVPGLVVDPLLEAFARHLMAKQREARPETARAARELLDLIGKDRIEAAKQLTASLAPEMMTPIRTESSSPIRAEPANIEVSPLVHQPETTPRPDEIRISHPIDPRAMDQIPTEVGLPVRSQARSAPVPVKRRWPLIVGGMLLIGGVVGFAMTRSDAPAPTAAPTPGSTPGPTIATAQPPREAAPPLVPAPIPAAIQPTPSPPPVTEPPPADVATNRPPAPTPTIKPSRPKVTPAITKPAITKPAITKPAITKPAITKRIPTPPTTSPAPVAPPPVASPPTPAVTAQPKSPPKRPVIETPTGPITRDVLIRLHAAVGSELGALGDKAGDLWTRYRMIRIFDEIASQERRDTTAAKLTKIRRDAALRR
ncbi:MAG: protein kinase [Kofleriaceae bacterium]